MLEEYYYLIKVFEHFISALINSKCLAEKKQSRWFLNANNTLNYKTKIQKKMSYAIYYILK